MPRRVFLLLYLMRAPLLILLFLGGLLPNLLESPMLHGLADLETNQIVLVVFAAFLIVSAALSCCFLVLLYGELRVNGDRKPLPPHAPHPSRWAVVLLYLLATFLFLRFLFKLQQIMVAAHVYPQGLAMRFWEQAAFGTFTGALYIVAIFLLDLLLSDPRSSPDIEVFALPVAFLFKEIGWMRDGLNFLNKQNPLRAIGLDKWLSRCSGLNRLLVRALGPGYGSFDEHGNPIEIFPGHRFTSFLALISFLVYLLAGRGVYHRLASDAPFPPPQPYDAVLLQVLILILLACWALSAFCFFFDRFRIPVLIPIALILLLTSRLGPSDHAFHTVARNSAPLPSPTALLAAKGGRVIVVSAAGGGIQSAAWSSEILCGLRKELGSAFSDSVLAISGVSGGSVGTMFYLRCLESPAGDMQGARAAQSSSLEAVAWGLAHPDLRRAILPIDAFLWPGADRGWALERALRKNAQFSPVDRPLAATQLQPNWPVVLLNATEVRTGDPLVFTNSDFPEPSPAIDPNHALHGFHLMYAGRDVLLESAVRMSAAFPYVSPAARPDTPWNAEHLVDGGYFDNSGLFTLTKWFKAAVPELPPPGHTALAAPSRQKILILSIDAFPDGQWNGPADSPKKWPFQLYAPASAVLHVRSEGQLVRDLADSSNLLQILSLRGYEAEALTIRYVPSGNLPASPGSVNCPEDPPLTWHLNEVEKACIEQEWSVLRPDVVAEIQSFLGPALQQPVPARALPSAPPAPAQITTKPVRKGLYMQKITR